jgi:hypothetical protein
MPVVDQDLGEGLGVSGRRPQRSIAVPRVGPKERPQFRHTQRGRPPWLPFWITWVAPQRGQGGSGNWAFDSSGPPPSESGPDYTTEHYSGERLPPPLGPPESRRRTHRGAPPALRQSHNEMALTFETAITLAVRATARSSSSPPAGTADTGPAESSVWPERSCCYPPGK